MFTYETLYRMSQDYGPAEVMLRTSPLGSRLNTLVIQLVALFPRGMPPHSSDKRQN